MFQAKIVCIECAWQRCEQYILMLNIYLIRSRASRNLKLEMTALPETLARKGLKSSWKDLLTEKYLAGRKKQPRKKKYMDKPGKFCSETKHFG